MIGIYLASLAFMNIAIANDLTTTEDETCKNFVTDLGKKIEVCWEVTYNRSLGTSNGVSISYIFGDHHREGDYHHISMVVNGREKNRLCDTYLDRCTFTWTDYKNPHFFDTVSFAMVENGDWDSRFGENYTISKD